MTASYDLQRFIDAQDGIFDTALVELKAGSKQSHWMWFIFPQLAGLGHSPTAQYFAIRSLDEAVFYLEQPVLGWRLRQCTEAMLSWSGCRSAEHILGSVDAMKLRSSLTLFDRASPGDLFESALGSFFDGRPDPQTLALLNAEG